MDCDGNNYTRNAAGNICHQETDRKSHLRSNDSLRNNGARCEPPNHQKLCEHERVEACRGSFPDGNTRNFKEKNIWEHDDHDPRYDNNGNGSNATGFDVNGSNKPCGRCKSGINVNVVLHQESPTNQKNCTVEPKYNVSFKHCCDDNNQRWEQKRKICSNPVSLTGSSLNLSQMNKCRKQETYRGDVSSVVKQKTEVSDENGSNFRCTFENCCGNCESYIMEIPQTDLSSYQNWQNVEFESGSTCFDDCCCPREMKVYSSNLSVASSPQHEQCCVAYAENEKCCSIPIDKCEFFPNDNKEASKHCLQRVHFAKEDNNPTRPNHSSCSFCSRNCTPSKASLFVEIGESIADVCNLRSAQMYRDSKESLKSDLERKEHSARKNNPDSSRARFRSKKRDAEVAKCSVNCKGLPAAVTRSYSDRIAFMEKCDEDRIVEEMTQGSFCGQGMRNAQSNVNFQKGRDCRAQTESNMCINQKTADCDQQCETIDRSLWEDIRTAKIWSQVQDTYKSLLKMATTGVGQIMKQSTKLKGFKNPSKDRGKINDKRDVPNECSYEEARWDKLINESNNCDASHCGNVCCSLNQNSNVIGFVECQKSMNQTCESCGNSQEVTSSAYSFCFDPNDVQGYLYACNEELIRDHLLPGCGIVRERGGSDGLNQRRKPLNANANKRVSNAREQPSTSVNRRNNNSRNQTIRKKPNPMQEKNELSPYDQQTGRTAMVIDMNLKSSTIRAVIDPMGPPYIAESVSYQKRIRAVKLLESYSGTIVEMPSSDRDLSSMKKDVPMIEKADSNMQPLQPSKEETKKPRKTSLPAQKKPVGQRTAVAANSRASKSDGNNKTNATSSKKDSVSKETPVAKVNAKLSTIGKEVQCEIIRENRVICGDKDGEEVPSQIAQLCSCSPQIAAAVPVTPTATEVQVTEKADNEVSLAPSITAVDPSAVAAAEEDAATAEEDASAVDEDAAVAEEDAASADEDAAVVTEDTSVAEEDVINKEESVATEQESAPQEIETTPEEEKEDTSLEQEASKEETVQDASVEQTVANSKATEITGTTESSMVDTKDIESTAIDASAEKSETVTSVTPLTEEEFDPRNTGPTEDKMEFSRQFRTRRNYVSVEMQTSSTILTRILSEFQVGNVKRRVLMNIKLQTTLNGNNEEEKEQQQQPRYSDTSVGSSQVRSLTRDDTQHYYQEGNKRTVDGRSMYPSTRNPRALTNSPGVYNESAKRMEYLSRADCNKCSGPCGRKQLR